ncbi:hypothetical protein D3C76_1413980 [compost metagenome]
MLHVPDASLRAGRQRGQGKQLAVCRKVENQFGFWVFVMIVRVTQAIQTTCGRVIQITVAVCHAVRLFQALGDDMNAGRLTLSVQRQRVDHVADFSVIDVRRDGTGADIQDVLAHGHLPGLDKALGKQLDFYPRQAIELAHLNRRPILHRHGLLRPLRLRE